MTLLLLLTIVSKTALFFSMEYLDFITVCAVREGKIHFITPVSVCKSSDNIKDNIFSTVICAAQPHSKVFTELENKIRQSSIIVQQKVKRFLHTHVGCTTGIIDRKCTCATWLISAANSMHSALLTLHQDWDTSGFCHHEYEESANE